MAHTLLLFLLLLGGDDPVPARKPVPAPKAAPVPPRLTQGAQRNENVPLWLIDTNAIKDANVRLGTTPTQVQEPAADTQYFAAEHGIPPAERLLPTTVNPAPGWHGEVFAWRQDALFNARAFFQVGTVKPSHRNFYGGRFTAQVPRLGFVTLTMSQREIRGMVNGNVLVPLPNERTPLATDPAKRAVIARFLAAYPNELPNRPDFDKRALNTNAPQRIDEINPTARLDRDLAGRGRLTASYSLSRQRIDAFQLVAGMNPDTDLHDHRARLAWTRSFSARTVVALAASFSRNRSALLPEPNAVGPRVRFGYSIEELGPDSQFPINRATDSFRYGASLTHKRAAHEITAGADLTRFRLNGVESSSANGYFQFMSNYGRTAIENLLYGTPSSYEVTLGDLSRGYRNWTTNAYLADRWRVHPRLQLYLGVRYTADSAPVEVRKRDVVPYGCDCNNVSPRFSLTWQAGRGWIARAMYTTTFGQILPVTYQQIRNNPPSVLYLQVQDPDLATPLKGVDLKDPNIRYTPTWLSPDLVAPYAHQYNASVERKIWGGSTLRLAYLGSRAFKLLNGWAENRAVPVADIPFTSSTIDARRPDPRYYDVRRILNAGIAYFDAGQLAWDLPLRHGLVVQTTYTFSKAIDQGSDFAFTGANKDLLQTRPQSQFDAFRDRKGLSNFDSPHALRLNYSWEVPGAGAASSWLHHITGGWVVSGAQLLKQGTPLTLFVGSDAPGFGNVDGSGGDRPNILDPSILGLTIGDPNTATRILSRDRFAYIRPGDAAGNLGRGTFRKSPIANWNAALSHQWKLANEAALVFRAEAYNFTNTPQFDEPQRNLSSAAFGKITNTLNDGRALQFTIRLVR